MAVDALTRARDVLRMVAIGIQHHHIQARDVEFMYDDGPKRVSVHRLAVEAMQGLDKEIAARAAAVALSQPQQVESKLRGRCADDNHCFFSCLKDEPCLRSKRAAKVLAERAARGVVVPHEAEVIAAAHDYLRDALGLPEDAPRRFDYYAHCIEKLRANAGVPRLDPAPPAARNVEGIVRMVYALRAAVRDDSKASADGLTLRVAHKAEGDLIDAIRALGKEQSA